MASQKKNKQEMACQRRVIEIERYLDDAHKIKKITADTSREQIIFNMPRDRSG